MPASRLPLLGAATLGTFAIVAAHLLAVTAPQRHPADTPETLIVFAVVGFVWLAAALVTLARQPTNALWRLILAYLMMSWLVWALQFARSPVVVGLALIAAPTAIAVLVHILVAYPSGGLRSPFDRRVVIGIYGLVIALVLLRAAFWAPDCSAASCADNPLVIWPNPDLTRWVEQAALLASPIAGAVVLAAIWRHWSAAAPAARRLLLPVALAVPIAYVVRVVTDFVALLEVEPLQALLDRYHAVVLLSGLILPGGLLLGVLRFRLGRARVAALMVELGRGVPVGGLRDVLARALGDPTLQLAFAAPSGAGHIDAAGHPVFVTDDRPGRALATIEHDGRLLAVLVHDRAIEEQDPGLIQAVSAAARMAIENEQLTAQVRAQLDEVRASRARIADAADAERRRVERDLHDGAQQRLVALALRLQLARGTSENASALIDQATTELEAAIGEVRDLARGLHPPLLTEAGLAAALETLAERSPVPVHLAATAERYGSAVETTAFFVVAEALTNAARHAAATEIRVTVSEVAGGLSVTVSDDGRGGADAATGTGLRGLADRVAALGGLLTVTSRPGEGTLVQADLPLG